MKNLQNNNTKEKTSRKNNAGIIRNIIFRVKQNYTEIANYGF